MINHCKTISKQPLETLINFLPNFIDFESEIKQLKISKLRRISFTTMKRVCNAKNNAGKIQNFINSTKTISPTLNYGATNTRPIGDSIMYIETNDNNHGQNVFVSIVIIIHQRIVFPLVYIFL